MRYAIRDLQVFSTPKAEKMFEFSGFSNTEFDYPSVIRTLLFGDCIFVRGSVRGARAFYQVVGRIYESSNPQATGEKHIGKLYVSVYDHPYPTRFDTKVERLEWYPDGSFDLIEQNGQRTTFKRPQGF